MNSITEFKREFSRSMRGYNPEEVDAAVEMLVSYGAELESANAEFAEVNDQLVARNSALAAENEKLSAELAAFRDKIGEAKDLIAEARRSADQLRAEAEDEAAQIRASQTAALEQELRTYAARSAAEQKRYTALCRRVNALAEAVRALYAEQMDAIGALTESIGPDAAEALQVESAEDLPTVTFAPPVKKSPPPPRVRRAAMAAAAIEPDTVELPTRAAVRRPEPVPVPAEQPAPDPEPVQAAPAAPAVEIPEPVAEETVTDAPTMQFSLPVEEARADGVNVSAVYRPASPSSLKVTREKAQSPAAASHSFAAVRRSLEEIGARLDQE